MVGPGLFLIGYNIGTGSVTTMASAGSRYGLSLFWLLIISCIFTYVMLIAYGRFYGQLMDVDVRRVLGLVRRPRGPGAMAAKERGEAALLNDVHGQAPKVLEPERREK